MRILQIIHDREPGDVQKLAAMIEGGLSARRFAVETVYLYPSAGMPALTKLVYVLRMARHIWRGGFDTLIAYQSIASVLVGTVGALAGCRLRVVHQTCTPAEMPRLLRLLDLFVGTLGLYTANIVNSAAAWTEFARYPAHYRRAMILIEHGLDAPVPRRSRDATRRLLQLPLTRPVLLNVGPLAAQKNQDVLIRTLACLPQAHLMLVGAGPKREALQTLAVTLGVEDRLHMPGALPPEDVADLYAAADLFVFPSAWEAFGLAAVEAAMVGMPMVVADLAALREVLRGDGAEPVAFVAPQDTEGWISGIATAIAAVPAAGRKAAFARAVTRKYSRQRMIESYLSLFEAYARAHRSEVAELHTAVEEARF